MSLNLTKNEVEILEDALTCLVDSGYADEMSTLMSGAVQHLISGLQDKLEDMWIDGYEDVV